MQLPWVQQSSSKFIQRIYQRRPAAKFHHLNRRTLFILPSKNGVFFLGVNAVLWLVGTNYENNLVLMLAFMLITLFIISILHTFANLSGLSIELVDAKPSFSGEESEVTVVVKKKGKRARESIVIAWPKGSTVTVDLIEQEEIRVKLFVTTSGRGWFNPGRLLVETYYPLGLFRCWIWPDMDCRILVYPRPLVAGSLPEAKSHAEEGDQAIEHGAEDFAGYRNYQVGDSLRNVAWKQYAKGMGLYSKEYMAHTDDRLWLDWDHFQGLDRESRLCRLCYWVLQAYGANREYGLRLPGVELSPASGLYHKLDVLKALALFEVVELQPE